MATEPKKTANMVVAGAYTTTTVTTTGDDLGSSDGIRKAVQANATAIRLLADHIDGIATDPATGVRADASGKPVDAFGKPVV